MFTANISPFSSLKAKTWLLKRGPPATEPCLIIMPHYKNFDMLRLIAASSVISHTFSFSPTDTNAMSHSSTSSGTY